jgi:hypothetical protein
MNVYQARELGERISSLVSTGQGSEAYAQLAPVLSERTPFRLLDIIGQVVGVGSLETVNDFLGQIAARKTEGGWVVIGSALGKQFARDISGVFTRCREFIVAADVWYGTDILGERVPGPALVGDFYPSLALLAPWRTDANPWMRRAVGVAVHFWAKRSRGAAKSKPQAEGLLGFLEPMFEERDDEAVKGIGWGLKTLGRYYPEPVAGWLEQQVVEKRRPHRALMLNKATTYLTEEQRAFAGRSKPA